MTGPRALWLSKFARPPTRRKMAERLLSCALARRFGAAWYFVTILRRIDSFSQNHSSPDNCSQVVRHPQAQKNRALAGPASSSPAWGRRQITFQRGRNCEPAIANLGGSRSTACPAVRYNYAKHCRVAQHDDGHASHALPAGRPDKLREHCDDLVCRRNVCRRNAGATRNTQSITAKSGQMIFGTDRVAKHRDADPIQLDRKRLVVPTLRVGDQKVAERLHARDSLEFFGINKISVERDRLAVGK
jgi:hypothetical protein